MGLMMQPHFRSGRPLSILPPLNAQHLSGDKAANLESALVTELHAHLININNVKGGSFLLVGVHSDG